MTFSEVKELLAAGFTHDEIMQFSTVSTGNPQVVLTSQQEAALDDPEPEAQNTNDGSQDPNQDPGQPAQNNNDNPLFTQLNETMNRLIRTIQTSNLQNNSFDKNAETDINKQVDSIMASIIRPEHKTKEA